MEHMNSFQFDMQYCNSKVDCKQYQRTRRPENWEIVMETSIKQEDSVNGFTYPVLCVQYHYYKIDTYNLFGPDLVNSCRFHVYSTSVKDMTVDYDASVEFGLEHAKNQLAKLFPNEVKKEAEYIAKQKRNFRSEALEQIENVVRSIIKRNASNLIKSDFSYITADSKGNWRAYYPTLQDLIDFHCEKPLNEQDNNYLNFLASDQLDEMRNLWSQANTLVAGE